MIACSRFASDFDVTITIILPLQVRHTMINNVDETIRQLLLDKLADEVGGNKDIVITFDLPGAPTAEQGDTQRLNLYLHDIRENLELRDSFYRRKNNPEDSNIVGRSRAPVRLNLTYLVTAEAGNNSAREHQVLSSALNIFLRTEMVPRRYMQGILQEQESGDVQLTVTGSDHPTRSDLAGLWRSLNQPLRPSLTLVATVTYDPFETKWVKVVREAVVGLRLGPDPSADRDRMNVKSINISAVGMVIDTNTELPLSCVDVSVKNSSAATRTDHRGFFCLQNVPPGDHILELSLKGFITREVGVSVPARQDQKQIEPLIVRLETVSSTMLGEVKSAASASRGGRPHLVEVDRQTRVKRVGRVVLADGKPAAFIPIRIGKYQTVTDSAGIYQLENLPPEDLPVVAEYPGCGEIVLQEGGGGDQLLIAPEHSSK